MKKIFAATVILLCTAALASAQDMAAVVEKYNNAVNLHTMGQKAEALTEFQAVMDMASALGDEGAEVVANCKNVIPSLYLSVAKGFANNQDIASAIGYLEKAVSTGKEYGDTATVDEASALITDLKGAQLMSKANALITGKDYAGAVEAYKEVLAIDPSNATASLRLGMAYNGLGDFDNAIAAFEQSIANTPENQQATAKKQVSNIYLKKANNAYKAKDMANALDAAQKSIGYLDNPNAQKISGHAALALKQYKVAAEAYEAYLAMKPKASDKVQITYQVATAYQNLGDAGKACSYFKEIAEDPKWGEAARYQITALKCN